MHREALRAFRTYSLHLNTARGLLRSSSRGLRHVPRVAGCFFTQRPSPSIHVPLHSSMYVRRLPVALLSGIAVGCGAWYYSLRSSDTPAASRSLVSNPKGDNAAPLRTVLVIGADELKQGTVVGEGPISKTTPEGSRKVVEMLTSDQAMRKLRRLEQSFSVSRGEGVTRYDLVQLPSNDPIEDDHAEKIVEVPNRLAGGDEKRDWMFWGVFDGHSGWTTSATLRDSLIDYVAGELGITFKNTKSHPPTSEDIDQAIKKGFNRLDYDIVHSSVKRVFNESSKAKAAELLQPALSGSCALLSFYDSKSQLLRVACTGDSRAVLGRRSESGKWMATALSEDQTGSNPREVARMRQEHPGEDVIRHGRVLGGLEPSRAFGDAVYKWSREISGRLRKSFFGRSASPLLMTPPYVTAEPVITTTKINPERGDFLVLATDGLWEMLTNEEVVGLVGQWIETQTVSSASSSQFERTWSKIFGSRNKPLPIEHGQGSDTKKGQRTPIRLQQWGIDPDTKDRFTVRDNNVATHLVRNALGGTNEEQVCALLTLPSPFSRRYRYSGLYEDARDDLTVQVIFFGNGEKTGEVTLNLDATAEADPPRAKL